MASEAAEVAAERTIEERDHVYVVELPGTRRWTEDYDAAFELATGRSLDAVDFEEYEEQAEQRITICHWRGRQYVLNLANEHPREASLNRQYECRHVAYGPPRRLPSECPTCRPAETDGGTCADVKEREISDEFVRKEAVPADEAESFVHLELDDAYHPTGGYWFPTGKKWGEATGWASRKYDIPKGELIQFPCDDREPEIRGRDTLPDWVFNRYVDTTTEQEGSQ